MVDYLKSHEIRLANTRELMDASGLNRTDFAEKIGVTYNLLSQYIGKNPTKKIGDETAAKIEKAFDKPSGFLDQINANGSTKSKIGNNPKMLEFLEKHGGKSEDEIAFTEKDIFPVHVYDGVKNKDYAQIDVVDVSFSCGVGESIEFHFDDVIDNIPIPNSIFKKNGVHPSNAKVIKAKGDSMSDKIDDGDYVGIDISQTEILDAEIYAVYFAGEGMIKQLFKEADGSIVLHSINKKYKDRIVTEENGSNFRVMGKYFYRSG